MDHMDILIEMVDSYLMKSSYRLNTSRVDGPPVTTFPLGFFVEDFTYMKIMMIVILIEIMEDFA